MKIAHVSPSYYPAFAYGSPPECAYHLGRYLGRSGGDVRVLTTDANGLRHLVDADKTREVEVEPGLRVRYCARRAKHSVSPAFVRELPLLVRWSDVVHLSGVYSFTTIPTLLACAALGKPVVWSPRGALLGSRASRAKEAWERACLAAAPRRMVVHVVSEGERAEVAARMPGVAVALVPNGVEVPERAERRARDETLRLLFFGRIHPTKGLENLIAACAELDRRGAAPWALTIAGRGDVNYEARIRQAIGERSLETKVTMVGEVMPEGRARLFAGADVLVAPSHAGTFGLAIAEALAHGVPAVASRKTEWQGLEEHGAGLWVANDAESLAGAIERVRGAPLAEMGERGRAWMKRELGWDGVAARMREVYERAAEPSR